MQRLNFSYFKIGWTLLLAAQCWLSQGADFVGGALRFDPPTIVGISELTRAPDDMPFSGDALGVDCYSDENRHGYGWLRLQFIWGGVPVPDGRRFKLSMETTNEFFQFIKNAQSKNPSPLRIATFEGFPAVEVLKSTNDSSRQRLHQAIFVQVKTNILFRMTVSAQTEAVFSTLSASLKTVKIDPEKLFDFIRPREPKITVLEAATVEIGFAPVGNREILAASFKTKDSMWSIVGGFHSDREVEKELLESLSRTLNELGSQSTAKGTPLRATVEIHRTGDGPDELQRAIIFHLGDVRNSVGQREGSVFSVARLLPQKLPDGFRKISESPFKVNLVIEDHSSRYPYKRP